MQMTSTLLRLLGAYASSLLLLGALLQPQPVQASADHGKHGSHGQAAQGPAGSAEMTDGEVRKVDREGAKLTLRHAAIKSLDMPSMTMVFHVRDKATLERLKVGDKVRFKVVNDGGKFTVTEIELVQ